jgi:serine/threonine protein kinase
MKPEAGMRLRGVKGRIYELNRPLGAGSFASVWRAEDPATNARYAIKIFEIGGSLETTADLEEANERERAVLTDLLKLQCPFLIRMDEAFKDVDSGLYCIAMTLVEGSSLHERM